jgi:hypothetical protein
MHSQHRSPINGSKQQRHSMIKLISIAVLSGATFGAMASPYAELSGSQLHWKQKERIRTDFKVPTVSLTVGLQINKNLAMESAFQMATQAEPSTLVWRDGSSPAVAVTNKPNFLGLYLRPSFAINDSLRVVGRLGFSRVSLEQTRRSDGLKLTGADTSLAWGAGLKYELSKGAYLTKGFSRL